MKTIMPIRSARIAPEVSRNDLSVLIIVKLAC